MPTPRPSPPWLLPALLTGWALASFVLPLAAPHWLSPPLAYGVTALGAPLAFVAIVAVHARLMNRR
ncbi:MAG: hypothetical protein LCH73_07490 [Proteobacteria bacterium]|nr:hypothetical protein [Pseudomonadota bacterium]